MVELIYEKSEGDPLVTTSQLVTAAPLNCYFMLCVKHSVDCFALLLIHTDVVEKNRLEKLQITKHVSREGSASFLIDRSQTNEQ